MRIRMRNSDTRLVLPTPLRTTIGSPKVALHNLPRKSWRRPNDLCDPKEIFFRVIEMLLASVVNVCRFFVWCGRFVEKVFY